MIKLWVHWEVYQIMASRPGLYANIHAKRKRIKAGSKEDEKKRNKRIANKERF